MLSIAPTSAFRAASICVGPLDRHTLTACGSPRDVPALACASQTSPRAPASRFAKAGVKGYCRSAETPQPADWWPSACVTVRCVGHTRPDRTLSEQRRHRGVRWACIVRKPRPNHTQSENHRQVGDTASDDGVANGKGHRAPLSSLPVRRKTSVEGSGLRSINAAIWPALASVLAIGTSPAISPSKDPASLY